MSDRRRGVLVLVLGVLAIGVAQHVAPVAGPPLYDGVVVVEPYRYLFPTAGQVGDPKSARATEKLEGGASPLTAIATPEQPPQAQIFATPGTLILPPGTTSIKLDIAPVAPRLLPTDGHIAGNVYRIGVTNQADVPLTARASDKVTVVLRGPADTIDAKIEQLTAVGWQPLTTEDAGFGSTFLAVVTSFGDFALVAPGPGPSYPIATPPGGPGASASGNPTSSTGASAGATSVPGTAPGPSTGGSSPGGPASTDGGAIPLGAGVAVVVVVGAGVAALLFRRRSSFRTTRPRRPR